ncbi:acylase [Candidatus Latescibacterota bacterium]
MRKDSRRVGHLVLLGSVALLLLGGCGSPPEGPEILWDTWGVPHIYADGDAELFRAFGWAQARSHGDLLLRLYGEARGRAAEYWGPEHLPQDRRFRAMGIAARGKMWADAQTPEMRANLEGFVAGINGYAAAHGADLDDAVEVVLPVTVADVLAHCHRVMHLEFVGRRLRAGVEAWGPRGSNGWAIAPSHSESGNSLLLVNPHLPWSGLYTWYEAHLVAPDLNMTGATLVGIPTLVLGFNDHLGWTHTDNPLDGMDLYELLLTGDGYLFDGESRAFEMEEQMVKVKMADGSLAEERVVVRRSVHGPILGAGQGRALAVRLAGLDRPHAVRQWWDMVRSRNQEEFVTALRQMQMPMWNVTYADADGHIMYLYGGLVPKRAHGDVRFWAGVVPGHTSATLWTEMHPFEDLPQVVDPPSGWVQNANDPPWTCTFPPPYSPDDFPPYLASQSMGLRPQRSAKMLMADESISFDELVAYKHSTHMEMAERLTDDLIAAARQYGNEDANEAADVLGQWDFRSDADSRGAAIFAVWVFGMVGQAGGDLYAEPWRPEAPLSTPDGLKDERLAAQVLGMVAAKMKVDYGGLTVPWGEGMRLRLGDIDLPASGGPSTFGIFRVLDARADEDGRFKVLSGDSFVAAVEFSSPVRGQVLLGYGNASQPGSPHLGDQLELMSQQKLRPAWRTRAEVEAHLELREVVDVR